MVDAGHVGVPLLEGVRARDVRGGGDARRQHGLAIAVEAVVDHPGRGGERAAHAGFEVCRLLEPEVAIDGRHLHRVADLRLAARPPRLDLAGIRAAVAFADIAVVALFTEHDAVATDRGTSRSGRALRLDLTVFRATIEGNGVAVVAALGAFLLAVPAGRLRALARAAVALVAELEMARR